MDDYDDNDLDNLVERHVGDEVSEFLELQQQQLVDAEQGDAEEKRIVPVKVRVKRPQPKLDPERYIYTRVKLNRKYSTRGFAPE